MGPKPKTITMRQQQLHSKERKDRAEFSDGEITDDEQPQGSSVELTAEEYRAFKDYLVKNDPNNTKGKEDNVREENIATSSVIEATPNIPSKSVLDQFPNICTPVFVVQLVICFIVVLCANSIHMSYLHANLHDKGVIEDTVNKLFENTVAETIDIKVEAFVNLQVKNSIDKQMEHVTNTLVTEVIDTQVARSIERMLIDNNLTLLNSAGKVLISSLESQFTKIHNDSKHIYNRELTDFQDQLVVKSKDIEDRTSSIHTERENKYQEELNDFKHQVKTVEDTIKDMAYNVQTQKTELAEKLSPINAGIDQLSFAAKIITNDISKQSHMLKEQKRISDEHVQFQDKLKQEMVIMETVFENAKTEINGLHSNMSLINQTLDTLLSRTVQRLNKIQSETELLLKEYQPKLDTNKDSIIKIIMLLFTMLFVIALFVCKLYQRPYGSVEFSRDLSRRNLNNMNSNAILNHIPSSPVLESMICIISFDEDRQRTHKKLLASVDIAAARVKCHVIRRHHQIPDLPRCRVYLMCVEFSERHVIIEEQGLGLGDLRKTTYEAVHKLGGHLIILYTKDPGSRRLKDDQIYNSTIYCVTNQRELVVVNNEGCFFSTYDNLTEGQKTHLRNKIYQHL